MKKYFTKEEIQIINTQKKLKSFIRKMHIKTMMEILYIYLNYENKKIVISLNADKFHSIVCGNIKWYNHSGIVWQFPLKLKMYL